MKTVRNNMRKLSLKGQDIRITGYIFLIIGIIIIIQSILFIFTIGSNLQVPINIYSETYGDFPIELYQLLNFITWLEIIFFVLLCGLKIVRTSIKIFHVDLDVTKNEKQDFNELYGFIKIYPKLNENKICK